MQSWVRGEFKVTTDRSVLDAVQVQAWLATTYWGKGISLDVVERSIEGSAAFGILRENELVGFGRVVTDYATFAWISDVFVAEPYRGKGLGKWLIECMRSHDRLQNLRRWVLATWDAHELYKTLGFNPLRKPENWLEIRSEDPYGAGVPPKV